MHGQFIWYELTTPDVKAAQKFYPKFTNWGLQPFDKDYTMFTAGGAPVAGLFALTAEMKQQGVPPNWMPYIEANDVDAVTNQAKTLGGSVLHGPAEVPGAGRFAVVSDPQGAVFGIYKSNTPGYAYDGTPVVGRPSWHELMTTDHRRAMEFYRALFEWNATGEMDMGGGAMYAMFGHGKAGFGGMFDRVPDMGAIPPHWLLYFHVPDVGKAMTAAQKAGGKVVRERMPIPGGTIAVLTDPQGAAFALHDMSPMPEVKPAPKAAAAATANKPAPKATAKKAAKKAAKKTAKKTAKKAAKKPAKKAARPAARAKRGAGKSARAVAKKPVRKATGSSAKKKSKAGAKKKR
jgi:predicted enzyme related to lactoylglutathione lyase